LSTIPRGGQWRKRFLLDLERQHSRGALVAFGLTLDESPAA